MKYKRGVEALLLLEAFGHEFPCSNFDRRAKLEKKSPSRIFALKFVPQIQQIESREKKKKRRRIKTVHIQNYVRAIRTIEQDRATGLDRV